MDVEGENVIREIFPFGSDFDQRIRVLQDVSDTFVEIGDAGGIGVPGCYVVIAGFSVGAIEGWEVVFGDVGVVAPAAELVAIVGGDCELDVWNDAGLAFRPWCGHVVRTTFMSFNH